MDLELKESGNGGDLIKTQKDLSVIYGLQNMVYLALFGGNVEASTPNKRLKNEQAFDWWGNSLILNNDLSIQFNSLTERKLTEIALTSEGRIDLERTVIKDLDFMRQFAEVSVSVTIPDNDKVRIAVKLKQPDNLEAKEFIYIWDGTKSELQ
jgi:phage gp46-like protein